MGTAPGGTSGERAFFFAFVYLNVLEKLGFHCYDGVACACTLHIQGPVWFCHAHPSVVPRQCACATGKYAAWFNLNSWVFTVMTVLLALAHGLLKALSGFAMHTQAWCPDDVHARWENMQPAST